MSQRYCWAAHQNALILSCCALTAFAFVRCTPSHHPETPSSGVTGCGTQAHTALLCVLCVRPRR